MTLSYSYVGTGRSLSLKLLQQLEEFVEGSLSGTSLLPLYILDLHIRYRHSILHLQKIFSRVSVLAWRCLFMNLSCLKFSIIICQLVCLELTTPVFIQVTHYITVMVFLVEISFCGPI